jgi:hypothetical protein
MPYTMMATVTLRLMRSITGETAMDGTTALYQARLESRSRPSYTSALYCSRAKSWVIFMQVMLSLR